MSESLMSSVPREPKAALTFLSDWAIWFLQHYEDNVDFADEGIPLHVISTREKSNLIAFFKLSNAALRKIGAEEFFDENIASFLDHNSLPLTHITPSIQGAIVSFSGMYQSGMSDQDLDDFFSDASSDGPLFNLDLSDVERIHTLLQQMREIVSRSSVIGGDHKARLFKRISHVEAETQKIKGRFDVILGGLNDFGEALGKFGDDVKPLVDRMKEVAGIVRSNTDEYKGLPAPEERPGLPAPSEEELSED